MGKLEVIFRIRLAYPLVRLSSGEPPAVVKFPETGNTVRIEAPQYGPPTSQPALEGFEQMVLHVERECTDEEGMNTSHDNCERFGIYRDAAVAFWQLFEAIREAALRRDNKIFTYPVVPAEDIRSNPLVRAWEFEWIYNGNSLEKTPLGRGIPAIEIKDDWWTDAVRLLSEGKHIPVYTRFALDAFYFAEHDPPRGIIMACAAWETALRYYLATVASKRDPAYEVASKLRGLPTLYSFAAKARGGQLFCDRIGHATGWERDSLELFRRLVNDLPTRRNKLLHEGRADTSKGETTDYALAALAAIQWLFEGADL